MTGVKKRTICTWAAAAVLIFAAVACRLLDMLYIHSDVMGLTRSAIYIFLFSAWAVSVRNRIIHVRIRRYLSAMSAFMVFWFLIRTVKFHFSPELLSPHLPRCLWYLYYLPMLFIPMLAVLLTVMDRTMKGESIYPDTTPVVQIGNAASTEVTPMQLEVLRLMVEGYGNSAIAQKLHISVHDVKWHIQELFSKTGYNNRVALVGDVINKNFIIPGL